DHPAPHSFPTRRSSDLTTLANRGKRLKPQFVQKITDYDGRVLEQFDEPIVLNELDIPDEYWDAVINGMESGVSRAFDGFPHSFRSEEHTSELQSRENLV